MSDYGSITIEVVDGVQQVIGEIPDRLGVADEFLTEIAAGLEGASFSDGILVILGHRFQVIGPARDRGVTVFARLP